MNGVAWQSADDFYRAYFEAIGAPEWHGRNLDALWDSLTGGGINQRNPPLCIRILGLAQMGTDARRITEGFGALVADARSEGYKVELELKEN